MMGKYNRCWQWYGRDNTINAGCSTGVSAFENGMFVSGWASAVDIMTIMACSTFAGLWNSEGLHQ